MHASMDTPRCGYGSMQYQPSHMNGVLNSTRMQAIDTLCAKHGDSMCGQCLQTAYANKEGMDAGQGMLLSFLLFRRWRPIA